MSNNKIVIGISAAIKMWANAFGTIFRLKTSKHY